MIHPAVSLAATPVALKWTKVNIPTEGVLGGWVLANGSDIQHLTTAVDGTLYAYVKGLTYTLYKSTDGGLRWSYIGNVQDAITGIAVPPNDTKIIYYATTTSVYKSSNGGKSFTALPDVPLATGENITSITVTWLNDYIVAIGTADAGNATYGGVYTLDESDIFPSWTDTNIGNYDVYGLSFCPNYIVNRQIVAVTNNETDTFVFNKTGNAEWNAFISPAVLDKDNSGVPTSVSANGSVIAFTNDYYSIINSNFYVGIKTGNGEGDVYKISCSNDAEYAIATDLNCGSVYGITNIDIAGLTVYSEGLNVILLAGATSSNQIFISKDGGLSWMKSKHTPTGESDTEILMAPDFFLSGVIYAATSGDNSALSISRDIGSSWTQISLIDTVINNIIDFVPSSATSDVNALFMITSGPGESLWRSLNDGSNWERILYTDSSGLNGLTLVNLPPQYGTDCQMVYVAGQSNGYPVIWVSKDNGQHFQSRFTHAPTTGVDFTIDAWTIEDENTFIASSYDGSEGMIYRTTDGGYSYSQDVPVGTLPLCSLALSPNINEDDTILAGNTGGWIYWSNDNGFSFQPLPANATSPPLDGDMSVAFDPEFKTNHTIYAASDTAGSGIYRFIIGSSEEWESIDDTLPTGAIINRLTFSANGVFYGTNSDPDGGMERCLNPDAISDATFETVTNGLSSGAVLSGLWQRDNQLWSLDNHNISDVKLMTFNDTLVIPPIQTSPENEISGIGSLVDHTARNIIIDWDTISGVTNYEWQCSYDNDFSTIPTGFNGTTSASSVHLPPSEPATTYYWRVRDRDPLLSPWSLRFSFTTCMDTEEVNLKPEVPSPGATDVSIKPVFEWTAVLGVNAYELLVATDADFAHPIIVKIDEYALKTNAWNCDINLDYNTVYYWKIRATTTNTKSAWSSVGIFTTETEFPVTLPTITPTMTELLSQKLLTALSSPTIAPSTSPPPPSAPAPSTAVTLLPDMPAWLIYILAGLFAVVLLSLLIVLVIVIKIRS